MNAWLVRPVPGGINRMQYFLNEGIIALGWHHIGDLTGSVREEIKARLAGKPFEMEGSRLWSAAANIDLVVNQMRPGDYILSAEGQDIYIGRVNGDYKFNRLKDNDQDRCPHQRSVEWLAKAMRSGLSIRRMAYLSGMPAASMYDAW